MSRARDSLFWIVMVSEVEQTVRNCTVCAQNQRANVKQSLCTVSSGSIH